MKVNYACFARALLLGRGVHSSASAPTHQLRSYCTAAVGDCGSRDNMGCVVVALRVGPAEGWLEYFSFFFFFL